MIPVIRNQSGNLPGDTLLHKAYKHEPSARGNARSIEIAQDSLVGITFEKEKRFSLGWLRFCCIFAYKNARIKYVLSTLKLMLFLQTYRGLSFLDESMNFSD